MQWESELPASLLVYYALLAAFSFGVWLSDVPDCDCELAWIVAISIIVGVVVGHLLF